MKNNNNRTYNFSEYKDKIDELIENKSINKLRLQDDYFDICGNYWIVDKYIASDGVFKEGLTPNTLATYDQAIKNKYAICIPVQMLDDGSIVCFSHRNISKVVPTASGYLKTMTLSQVKEIKLNDNGDTIPTLEEALNHIANRTPIIIEVLNDGMVDKFETKVTTLISKYIADNDCYNSIAVMSINPYTLEFFFNHYPYITRILKSGAFTEKMYGSLKSKKLKKLKYYKITQADFIAYSYNLLPAVAVEKHKPVGTLAYTVTSQQHYISTAEHCDNIIFRGFEPKI